MRKRQGGILCLVNVRGERMQLLVQLALILRRVARSLDAASGLLLAELVRGFVALRSKD